MMVFGIASCNFKSDGTCKFVASIPLFKPLGVNVPHNMWESTKRKKRYNNYYLLYRLLFTWKFYTHEELEVGFWNWKLVFGIGFKSDLIPLVGRLTVERYIV